MNNIPLNNIHKSVQEHYGRLAQNDSELDVVDCCADDTGSASCDCSTLYEVDTTWLPQALTGFSLGCGDPITLAELQPGQTVLDLGSGGGLDCFLAAEQVGAAGHVIGVDMTPEMLAKANRNKEKLGAARVEFRLGQIEAMPVDSATIDVIISNCVINLSPNKPAVLREAYRVLKPGGRLAISDIVTEGRFSNDRRADMSAWSSCVSGAEEVSALTIMLRDAGFVDVSIRAKDGDDLEYAAVSPTTGTARPFSARITAVKPVGRSDHS